MVALSIVGSATLLFSCSKDPKRTVVDYETLMTESSEHRTIVMMENGMRSYVFSSPLVEGYSLAKNPYQEFRRGITLTTFTSDSLSLEDATITANYAIYYERQKLWEAKGNVVIIKKNRQPGDTTVTGLTEVYTQQLFWNATTKKIYSNVDTKVLQPDGWHFGVGFDADDDLKNIHFRKYSSEMEFEMSQAEPKTEEEKAKEEKEREKEKREAANKANKNRVPQRPASYHPPKERDHSSLSPSATTRPTRPTESDQRPPRPTPQPARENKSMGNVSLQSGTLSSDINPSAAQSGGSSMQRIERPDMSVKPTKSTETTIKK